MQHPSVVLDQHLLAAAVLWQRRQRAVAAPHFSLRDLVTLDGQLDANLAGVRLAGQAAWEACLPQLKWRDSGDVFVAAGLAIESQDADRVMTVLRAIDGTTSRPIDEVDRRALRTAVVSALIACGRDLGKTHLEPAIELLQSSADPFWRFAAVAWQVDAWLRCSASSQHNWQAWLGDPDPDVRFLSARAIGLAARGDALEAVKELQEDTSLSVQAAVQYTLMLRGDDPQTAARRLQSQLLEIEAILATDFGTTSTELLDDFWRSLCVALPIAETQTLIRQLSQGSEREQRLAVQLGGELGIRESLPWMVELLASPTYGRVAAEAFSRITGLRLDQAPFEAEPPVGHEFGPNDDPDDEDVALDADEHLPWAVGSVVADWFMKHAQQFERGVRYLLGYPMDIAWLSSVLKLGRQRERRAAAVEIAVRRNTPVLDVASHTSWQLAQLDMQRTVSEEERCDLLAAGAMK
ncbi:MAG: TIGR02270 family protein [Pirellulaceae bacterium]